MKEPIRIMTQTTLKYNFVLIITFLAFMFLAGCGKNNSNPGGQEPQGDGTRKNLVLLMGDGMGLSQITAASIASGGMLNLSRCRHIGLQKVYASDQLVPSSASTGTAMFCGVKTKYLHIGVDHQGNRVPNITEILESGGIATGLITTSFIADATPATFYAHNPDRYAQEAMAAELVGSGIDVIIGGGRRHLNARADSLNLLDSLSAYGYQVFDNLEAALQVNAGKVACFTDEYKPLKVSEGRGDMLARSAEKAVKLLESNDQGFFLLVEGAQIDWACHDHDADYMLEEMMDFDDAVGKMLDYADSKGNTLVVILGDHETGGYALAGGSEQSGEVVSQFTTTDHTAAMIPVFAHGPGADQFTGVYENTELFDKFMNYFAVHSPEK